MVELIVRRTGIPAQAVRHILDTQSDIMRTCLIQQETVHFPKLLKIHSESRVFRLPDKEDTEDVVVLKVRPMQTLKTEMNRWKNTE